MRRFLNNRISNYNNVGDKVDDFCEDCENRWLPFSRVWWDSTEKNIADIKRKDNGIFVIKKILSLINSISESIKDIYDRINVIELPILSEKLIELENDYLEVGVTADDKQEDLNIAIYENYINLKNTKVNKPIVESTSDSLKIVALDNQGESVFIKSSEVGKVKSVNNKIGDVILKTSDLENDSDYTTNAILTAHTSNKSNPHNVTKEQIGLGNVDNTSDLNKPISTATQTELNKKLDKPTTNNTPDYVLLADGSTAPKSDFGKVDKVNNLTPDVNKNVNLGIDDILPKGMPLEETLDYNKKVLLYDDTGKSYWKSLSEVGKVKTVNNQEPDENGNIKIEDSEFVKNGVGWSLKYKKDNPDKYEITGENAVDLTKAYPDSAKKFGAKGKDSFAVGAYNLAGGIGSLSMGYGTETYGNISIVAGYLNKTYSAYTTIFGGSQNTIGTESEITNPITSLNSRAIIAGGQFNSIVNGKWGTIIGGYKNTIDAGNKYNNSTNPLAYNSILGGYFNTINNSENSIIVGGSRNKINQSGEKVITSFVTGQENETQGSFTTVFGYRNKAVTQGETIVGFGATIQDESLLPTTYYDNGRMFSVGVGVLNSNNTLNRRDGLSVYQNGLVLAPTTNNALIEANNKAVTTKEFVDNKISNFSLSTNWTSSQQRFSGLEDKSADATYNKVMVLDNDGNAGVKDVLNPDTLINILESATTDQIVAIRSIFHTPL